MKKNSIWIVAVLILTILAASAFAQTKAVLTKPQPTPGAESVIEDTNVVIKVVGLKDNAAAAEATKPAEGNKFISVQIIIDNSKGEEEWQVKPEAFKLKDAEGNIYETTGNPYLSTAVTQPTLKQGPVDSGDFVKGWITFEVGSAVKAKSLKIRYEDSGVLGSDLTVKSGWILLSEFVK